MNITSKSARNTIYSRVKRKKRYKLTKHLDISRLDKIRAYLHPFFLKLNHHYRVWGNKLDAIIFVLIITSIPLGQFRTFLGPIVIYYVYLSLIVSFRIFMQWEFFYSSCRMIALWFELRLTGQKGFHNRFVRKK